jgi:hypothetical protein
VRSELLARDQEAMAAWRMVSLKPRQVLAFRNQIPSVAFLRVDLSKLSLQVPPHDGCAVVSHSRENRRLVPARSTTAVKRLWRLGLSWVGQSRQLSATFGHLSCDSARIS